MSIRLFNPSGGFIDLNAGGDGTAANVFTLPAETGTLLTNSGTLNINSSAPDNSLTIDSSGNVGIGTNSPTDTNGFGKALDVQGSSGAALYVGASGDRATYGYASNELHIRNPSASGTTRFYINDTEWARITSNGFFKQTNTGSYLDAAANQNEFNSNQNQTVLWLNQTNDSFGGRVFGIVTSRTASGAFSFGEFFSDAFGDVEFNFRGDGNGYADGAFNNNGADYAEFFESANGQALTLGATVVLDGNKVREATDQDPASAVIGVVRPKEPSKASMIIGNTAWNKWANKYLSDDFDRYIMEDHDVVEWTDEEGKFHSYESQSIPEGITVPEDATRKTHDEKGNKFQHYKLNPEWDKDSEYVNRENRPEWNIIGLLGQVKILKGQPVGDRWIKMRDVSETVEEWFIR